MTRLKPVIAGYSGAATIAISRYLTDGVTDVIADVAEAPKPLEDIPPNTLAELIEMHVLREQDGIVMLNTAVFLRDDIAAGLYRQGRLRSAVITATSIGPYEAAIRAIADSVATTYAADLGALEGMLRATTAGRHGVPIGSVTMHLWRYVRRIVARALYDCGFFRDDVRESGTLTVFYENDVELLRELLI